MTTKPCLLSLYGLLAAVLLSSCAAGYNRAWDAAAKHAAAQGIEGAYAGSWQSTATGHHGRLRCIVGPSLNAQGDHDFHYHATWQGILSGAYHATHRVTRTEDGYQFTGQHKMPAWAGGMYNYEGVISGADFRATYRADKDAGAFTMKRARQ